MEEIKKFLIISKKKTYASFLSRPKKIKVGGKRYLFRKADLTYVDIYHGGRIFSGKELVLSKESPIWSMVYFGGIKEERRDEKKIYRFLKSCLRKIPKDFPVRGPKEFSKGNLKYINKLKGNFENFQGKEEIFFQGKLVYTLNYFGGKII